MGAVHDCGRHVLKDVLHKENALKWSYCCCCDQQDEGDFCWAWSSWYTLKWQWSTICQCSIPRIHSWMGIWTHHIQPTLCCIKWICRVKMVKVVKTAFIKAKYSGEDPQLALLTLCSTPVDAHLPSPTQLLFQCKLKTKLLTQPGNTDPCAEDHQGRLSEKAVWTKDNHDWWARTLLPLFTGQSISILNPGRGIWISGTVIRKFCHNSYLVKTTTGAVYQCTRKHLWDRQVNKPDLEPPSADLDISEKALKPVHAPLQKTTNHAPAAALQPTPAATQCTIPRTPHWCTPAKTVDVTPQWKPSSVQASIEQKVPAPPSVPAAKVPASSTSHTSLATCWLSHTCHVPECLIEQMRSRLTTVIWMENWLLTILADQDESRPWLGPQCWYDGSWQGTAYLCWTCTYSDHNQILDLKD